VETALSNEIYLRNIRALWRTDPRLAWQIDDHGEPQSVRVLPARSGAPTGLVTDRQGRSLYLHSRHDPAAEADRLVASVPVDDNECFVICGLGLGHHVRALFDRTRGEGLLLICEPNLDVIAAAMFSVDLSAVLESGRCTFLTRTAKDEIHAKLEPWNTTMILGTHFVAHPPSERLAPEFFAAVRAAVTDYIAYCRTSVVTAVANSRITCKNIAFNLPAYLSTPPIDPLRNRFAGLPAIIVSAGPSLRRNLDRLADLRDRAVLIAVQTTLKPLLARGIRPHFVTSLDFHEVSRSFFQGIDPAALAEVHLVAEPKATWHVIDEYPGPVSLLDNSFARLCLGDTLAARDGLKGGATVAHLSFYLAEHLGCDPIIFLGQDLAYTDHLFYTPGVAHHEAWRPELNRFVTIEMKEWERIVRRRNILRKVRDIHGTEIYTDETLFTYLEQFEGDFARSPARVIDATEGGARKRYTSVMTLAEAARQFCTRPIPPDRFDYLRRLAWRDGRRLEAGRAALRKRAEAVREIRDASSACIDVLKELMTLTDRPAEFNRRLARVDDLRARMQRHEQTYRMISMMSQHAELRRFRADRSLQRHRPRGPERAKRQLARDIEFLSALIEGADALLQIFEQALARFDEAIRRGPSHACGPQGGPPP